MSYLGFLDVPYSELEKYMQDVEKKKGTCKVIPRARMGIFGGDIRYDGLICSPYDMGGKATGVAALNCKNCILENERAA